jgi:tRNA(Ile)-lysidine synthase
MAVSGGPDSVALAHILSDLASRFSLSLGMAHLNHGLRGIASDQDADFVKNMASVMGLPCHMEKRDVSAHKQMRKVSLEEAAREIRYAFLEEIAEERGYDKIALGHQADDNSELLLIFLLRGCGPTGFSGIPARRNEKIIRPLLELTRREIMAYIQSKEADFVEDLSNTQPRFLRNRIRSHLIPLLQQSYNPQISRTLNRFSEIVRAEDQWMGEMISEFYEKCRFDKTPDSIGLSVLELRALPLAALRRVLRRGIAEIKGNLRGIAFGHIEDMISLLQGCEAPKHLHLPAGIRVLHNGHLLYISRKNSVERDGEKRVGPGSINYQYMMTGPGVLEIKEIGASLHIARMPADRLAALDNGNPQAAFMDAEAAAFPLTIRNFKPGDRFRPLGINGTQKLKKYFSDHKIPGTERELCPVLLSNEKILWVAGHRLDESAKVTALTRHMVKAELLLA